MNDVHVPPHERIEFGPRTTKYLLCIPVINEGARLEKQLQEIRELPPLADVLIADGGSTDESTAPDRLRAYGVRTLLTVDTGGAGVSRQLQAAFAYGLAEGYAGIVTIDGNNKDDVAELPLFLEQLDRGAGFVQGSRFAPGGRAINTPLTRLFGIKLLHAPLLSLAAGFRYHDTTNGFRGYSRALLEHPQVQPFRPVIRGYEMLWYLSVRAPRTGHRVVEVPVCRRYPARGKVPTKISPLAGKVRILREIFRVVRGRLDSALLSGAARGGHAEGGFEMKSSNTPEGLQAFLFSAYRVVRRSGVFSSPVGGALYSRAYFLYKDRSEAKQAAALRRLARPGSIAYDIGANIGYFTAVLSRAVGPSGSVVAFEPDGGNLMLLHRTVTRHRLDNVSVIAAAVGERTGGAELCVNADNPADHRMYPFPGHHGRHQVQMTTLDAFAEEHRDTRPVSAIKIDVQGTELDVLRGMERTLSRQHDAHLLLEVAPDHLRQAGSGFALIQIFLAALGFSPFLLNDDGRLHGASWEAVDRLAEEQGYIDVVLSRRPPQGTVAG